MCEFFLTKLILDLPFSKRDQWYASVCVLYEDFGDVDNYIDSRGDYMTIASALTLGTISITNVYKRFYFLCWIHTFIRGGRGISLCVQTECDSLISNDRLSDFVITNIQMRACIWMKVS